MLTLQILGLDVCANMIIGDGMRRGVSGGQKKRVTTGMPKISLKITFNTKAKLYEFRMVPASRKFLLMKIMTTLYKTVTEILSKLSLKITFYTFNTKAN